MAVPTGGAPRAPSPRNTPQPPGQLRLGQEGTPASSAPGSGSLRSFFERWRTGVPGLRDHPETQRQRDKERPGPEREGLCRGGDWARAATGRGQRGRAGGRVSERGEVSVRLKEGGRGARSKARSRGKKRRGAEAADGRTDGPEGREGREESGTLTSSVSPSCAPSLSAPGSPPLSGRAAR